ncbi:MAG TPA: hypothetical protein VGP87_10125 [Gemmatimonadales bacterium]|jgi:protein tyrosine phosphatase (PTP) superfamily phosphohydrolase (DUF442 family)|nr:hypothetical protein [Gemmatimonadales bacterium]
MALPPNYAEPLPGFLTSGQPSPEQFRALSAGGVKTVIDIRDPMEPRGFDEPALVRELGMTYLNISVRQGALDDAVMDATLAAIRQHDGQPLLLHCASANRVGGVLIPYFMIDKGMNEEDAVATAMKVGLRGADLLEWGLEYTQRKTGG